MCLYRWSSVVAAPAAARAVLWFHRSSTFFSEVRTSQTRNIVGRRIVVINTRGYWWFRCTVLKAVGLVCSSTRRRARIPVHLLSTGSTEVRRLIADGLQTNRTGTTRVVSAWMPMVANLSITDVARKTHLYARKLEVCMSYVYYSLHKYFHRYCHFSLFHKFSRLFYDHTECTKRLNRGSVLKQKNILKNFSALS